MKGPSGPVGNTGGPGVVTCWNSYRDFYFNCSGADLTDAQKTELATMADYLKRNPSLIVAIDGYSDPNNKDLSNSRVNAIRDTLINDGVPADRIKTGTYGDSKLRRSGRVEVLIKSGS